MRKIISSIVAITTILTSSLNCFQTIPKTNAASYRTSYKIYGDLNNDKAINSFDVISMRKAVISGDTNQDLDFNRDDKVDSADLTLLSDYVLGKNSFFDAYLCDDADEDSVCDMLEIAFLQSDPDSEDTDGDTLTDFEEIVYSNTSPTNKNSRGLAVTDAEDDADGDKLTNKEEIANKTNPQADDSDLDGINDYDELNKYNTDPNNEDSDNDGIIDGDEIKLGLKPDSDKSDGQTLDNQRIIEQIIPADSPLLSNINTDDNAYNLSLIINASGCADSCLSVNPSGFAYVMKDGSAIGEVPALQYSDDFTVKDITIKFEIKEAFRDNVSHYFDTIDGDYYDYTYTVPTELDGIKRLNIFKYFEDVNLAMPIETLYDTENNIVYTKITKFETDENGKSYGIGSYSLVDLEVWSDIMNSDDETSAPKPQNAPMSITLDSNYSILGNEGTSIVKSLKEMTDSIRDAITKTYESYQVSNNESDDNIHYISLFGHQYACIEASQIDWAAAEAKCETMGGHLMTVNTPMELSLLNGSLSEGKNGGFYWLGASGGSSNWSWVTGESTSYAKTVKVSGYDMDHCRNYFSYLGNKLAYVPHLGYLSAGTPSTSKIKGYICEWENAANKKNADGTGVVVSIGGRKITLNGIISASSGNDTDHDGVSDYDEVDVNAIKKIGGSSSQTITWKQGHDYLNNKGYISDKSYDKIADLVKDISQNRTVYPVKSNPAAIDSDGDGLLDCDDELPLIDTSNTNYIIYYEKPKSREGWEDSSLKRAAYSLSKQLYDSEKCEFFRVSKNDDFIDVWNNSIPTRGGSIHLFLHGAEASLCFDEEEMSAELIDKGKYNLKNKSIKNKVYLYACEGAKMFDFESPYESVHISVARAIAKLCAPTEVIATEDEVDYFRAQIYYPETTNLIDELRALDSLIPMSIAINIIKYDNVFYPYTHHRDGTWLSISYDKSNDSYITNDIGNDWHE